MLIGALVWALSCASVCWGGGRCGCVWGWARGVKCSSRPFATRGLTRVPHVRGCWRDRQCGRARSFAASGTARAGWASGRVGQEEAWCRRLCVTGGSGLAVLNASPLVVAAKMEVLLWLLLLVGVGVWLCSLRGLLWLLVAAGFGEGICVSARFRVPPGVAGTSLAADNKADEDAVDGRQVGFRWNGCPFPRGAF